MTGDDGQDVAASSFRVGEDGQVWFVRGGQPIFLGEQQEVFAAMESILAEMDYGERPFVRPDYAR